MSGLPRHLHIFHRKPDLEASSLVDWVSGLCAGFMENGFRVSHGEQVPDDAIVLVFEGTYPPPEMLESMRGRGPVGCIVTEILSQDRFYDQMNYWDGKARLHAFERNLPHFDFVWSTVPQNVELIEGRCPTAFLEFGYSPLLAGISMSPPEIDFSYFGLVSPYRQAVLAELSRFFKIVAPGRLISRQERDAIVSRTKFNLALKQTSDWPLPSATRLGSILHLEGAVLRDWTPIQTAQSSLVPMPTRDDDFVEYCHEMTKQDRDTIRLGPAAGFKEFRMKDIIRDLLNRTVPSWRGGSS